MNDSNWDPLAEQPLLESVRVFGVELRVGDRVRLWPQKTADIMDMALQGTGRHHRSHRTGLRRPGASGRRTGRRSRTRLRHDASTGPPLFLLA